MLRGRTTKSLRRGRLREHPLRTTSPVAMFAVAARAFDVKELRDATKYITSSKLPNLSESGGPKRKSQQTTPKKTRGHHKRGVADKASKLQHHRIQRATPTLIHSAVGKRAH